MITTIQDKIRALIEDFTKTLDEPFVYSTSKSFILSESKNVVILGVQINGVDLASGETYDYNEETGKITIGADLSVNDVVVVSYSFNCYSDSELAEYIKASLTWISIYSSEDCDYEIEETQIQPTPDNKTSDLIAIIASILIKPNFSSYRLPTISVSYPEKMSKDEKIKKIIDQYKHGYGINDILQYDDDIL